MPDALTIALSLILALGVGFLIHTLVEMRKAAQEMREFLKHTSDSFDSTMDETKETLRSVRNVTDTINDMSSDVRKLSSRVSDTAKNVRGVAHYLGEASGKTKISTIAMGAGVKAAFDVLSNRLTSKKSDGKKEVSDEQRDTAD
ncbi:MAG: DUF948 domain-containing protein [Nitrospirota bacterium]|jgi:uncharacterized protein YoxC